MWQWMGGSRKKVATSRNSIQKRQREYFEQKRRQQQRESALVERNAGGSCTIDHQKGSRSLDILNLLSFSKTTEECEPRSEKEKMSTANKSLHERSSKIEDSENDQPANNAPSTLIKDHILPTETRIVLSNQGSTMSPESFGVSSTQRSTSNVRNPELKCLKNASSTQYSILDLIGDDDGPTGTSEGNPEYEAHVAFSIEGLGNVGTETPMQSPKRTGRLSEEQLSYTKAFEKHHLVKNCNVMLDDLGNEVECLVEDNKKSSRVNLMDPFFMSEDVQYPLSCADHEDSSLKGCARPDRKRYPMNSFHERDRHSNLWNEVAANCCFLDDDENDEKSGSYWRNVNATKNFYSWGNDVPDLKFEGCSLPFRYQQEVADKFNILDEEDCCFRSVEEPKRYSSFMSNYMPESRFPWEDPRDTLTSLSEESCTSSAAKDKSKADVLPRGCRKRFHEDLQRPLDANDYDDEGIQNRVSGSMRQGEDLNKSRNYTRSNLSHLNPIFSSQSTMNEKLGDKDSWMLKEGFLFSSISTDPDVSFRQSSCEKNRHWERDLPCKGKEADLVHDTKFSFSKSEKDTLNEFPLEKTAFGRPFRSMQSFNTSCFTKNCCVESWPSVHGDSKFHVKSLSSLEDADFFGDNESAARNTDLSAQGSVTVKGNKLKSQSSIAEKIVVPFGNENIMPESRSHGDANLKETMAYSSDGNAKGTSLVMNSESDDELIARELQERVLTPEQDSKVSRCDAVGFANKHKVVAESCGGPALKIMLSTQSGQVRMVERYVLQLLCLAKGETVIQDASKKLL